MTEERRNLPKKEEKNKFILFFYSQTKNCRLPSLNGIILLLNKRKKSNKSPSSLRELKENFKNNILPRIEEEEIFLENLLPFFEILLYENRRRKSSQLIAGTPFRRIRKYFFFLKKESRRIIFCSPPVTPHPPKI